MHRLTALVSVGVFCASLLFLTSRAHAQIPQPSDTTSVPNAGAGHDYLEGLVETVNPANGSVSIRLPVILPPSRGITLPFSFMYDSALYYLSGNQGGNAQWARVTSPGSSEGWSFGEPIISATQARWVEIDATLGTKINCQYTFGYVFQDASGARHNLNVTNFYHDPNTDCQSDVSGTAPNGFDGSEIVQGSEGPIMGSIPSTWTNPNSNDAAQVTVTDGDGTVYRFSGTLPGCKAPCSSPFYPHLTSVTDRNGNIITITNPSNTSNVTSYVDTSGRTVLQDSGFEISPEAVTVSGLGAAYTINWTTQPNPTFASSIQIQTLNGTCTQPAGPSASTPSVSSIALPDSKSYTFAYDTTYGLVNKITYPTGGYVRYVWGQNPLSHSGGFTPQGQTSPCVLLYSVPAITDRYVSFDGSTEVLHQAFSYSTAWPPAGDWTGKTTTVTTTDHARNTTFTTVYTYAPIPLPVVPGAPPNDQDNPANPVETTVVYNDTSGSLLKTVTKTWRNERVLLSQTNTYPSGPANETAWNYDANELQIEKDDYDFGTSGVGSLLRKTVTTYDTRTAFNTNHILDKPAKVQVYDSTGSNLAAETDFGYDTPAATATSGIVQHSGGCKCGNVTSISRWVDSSGKTLTTTFTNDDTGQRLSATDPRGYTTSYSYTDSYSSGTPPSPTNAYLTKVTHPVTNGVSHIENYAYDYASGEVTSSSDQNNLVTTYKYVDNLGRLTETDFPDGGQTSITYNDAAYNPSTPSPSVTTTKKINTAISVVTMSARDGLGHVVRTELTSDPQGPVYTDTAYDGMGRMKSVSNPYRTGTDPTSSPGTTTYTYDAIGRTTSETTPDGSVTTTAYCAGSTLVTDPTNHWRRSRTDGLGRLVEVDEPNSVGAIVDPSACPGTGEPIWITSYTVDTLGNLTHVVQNGSHHRSFAYDFLSRLGTSNNPEVGTTNYSYDGNSNVTSKISTAPNQTTGAGAPGTGSAAMSGSEQSIPGLSATPGKGSVTLSGTLQQKQQTQPATPGTGSVTISGTDQSTTINTCPSPPGQIQPANCTKTIWDQGTVSITVNGYVASTTYNHASTAAAIASSLASIFNNGANSPVTATITNATVSLTSKATGAASNYSLSATSATTDPTYFSGPSFDTATSGPMLTGGRDATSTTVYDSGTCTIAVSTHGDSTNWSGSGTTTSSIASALVSGINADGGAVVSALLSGSTVSLTAKATGASTNYSLSSSCSYDSSNFSGPSFTPGNSGSSLMGGQDATGPTYDQGSVWITVNGTQYSASYGQGSTPSAVANSLATAINSSPGVPVTASVSSTTLNLTAASEGSGTNYSLATGSSSSNGFSPQSFSVSASASSLTGGTDPTASTLTITYFYDALNREISRTYSNGDPSISTSYDQSNCLGLSACSNIGHRTGVTDAAGSESWSYQVDPTNHRSVHQNQRTTGGVTKNTTYYLDLSGNVSSITYPTGRVVNYGYNAADRPTSAQDSANGITYATAPSTPLSGCPSGAVCYTPQGSIYSKSLGVTSSFTGLNISETFNNRLQPNEIKASSSAGNALDISYNFVDPVSGHNSGHVYGITNSLNSSRSQSFTYDQVHRLLSAGTAATTGTYCWGYQYSYDAWGNLLSQAGWSPNYNSCSQAVMGGVAADWGSHVSALSYDASGNTISEGLSYAYTWNAEGQMKTAAGMTYAYDADGRRAAKLGSKLYWYGSGGEILAETNASGAATAEYIFFGGKRIAMLPSGSGAQYFIEDFLGSSRVVTQNNGAVCYDADFTPFGGERAYTNGCAQNAYKFEGKERDSETGNDEFGARYYSSRFGRWLSADWSSVPVAVPYANLTNPQTLNLYAMVADDPESFADLDGHGGDTCNGPNNSCEAKNTRTVQGNTNLVQTPSQAAKANQDAKNATAVAQNTGQQIPGTPFTVTNFEGLQYPNGAGGVAIGVTANCSDCTAWVQTFTRTGAGDVFGREVVDKGNTAANQAEHYSDIRNPVYGGGDHFSDMPGAPKGGSFKAVVWVGTADLKKETFTTHAAFEYSFSVSKSGKLTATYPRAATKAEQAHSLKTIRADSYPWTIK